MAKIQITKTELVWPGKYREDGMLAEAPRANLPFQTLEVFGPEAAWRNKLIWGDNLLVMGSLLEEFAGKIDLIYIDPPFATGADFAFPAAIGQQEMAYRDTWNVSTGSYLAMMAERLRLIGDLLSPTGSLFLHCDWHVSHLLRAIADEVFGAGNFLNEIVWYYYNKFQGNVKRFASNHDVVLWYRKSASYQFNQQIEKRAEGKVKQLVRIWDKDKAAIVNAKGLDGKVMYRETDQRTVDDVWRISMLQPADRTENCGFPTQKPEALLQRILETASSPGDLVADFFCGSGTMLSVAEKLNRRWIGCDLGRWGIHTTRKRLLGIKPCRPFALLNLGKYERQYWRSVNFNLPCEYVAFILKLYGAEPANGLAHIDGKKSDALVRVGAVDLPITTAEVDAAVDECAKLKQRELHILGWDWDTRRCDVLTETAGNKGVRLLLLQIPREVMEAQATQKADVRFFSLAYLEAEIGQPGDLTARVTLKNFVILNTELVAGDVRGDWSDYIDYWAVDWDSRSDTFVEGWAAYRTRKERKLPLVSGCYAYDESGRRRILVRVIDIFGNETRQGFDVEVS
ncbi:MAG TPA: site-specific DNA-methyltransferase [Acidobacteriaceae bacterium]|jgi:DNA modification methylase|nr:site-specific DNA-methyltransferase [Acidobacteriaceae bacterium]